MCFLSTKGIFQYLAQLLLSTFEELFVLAITKDHMIQGLRPFERFQEEGMYP